MSTELTLGEREAITGRVIRWQDAPGEPWYCADCLAGLPGDAAGQSAHCCGPEPGDVVWYHGGLRDMHGVWEVTAAAGGVLRLVDVDRTLSNVSSGHVRVLRKHHERGKEMPDRMRLDELVPGDKGALPWHKRAVTIHGMYPDPDQRGWRVWWSSREMEGVTWATGSAQVYRGWSHAAHGQGPYVPPDSPIGRLLAAREPAPPRLDAAGLDADQALAGLRAKLAGGRNSGLGSFSPGSQSEGGPADRDARDSQHREPLPPARREPGEAAELEL